MFKLLHVLIFYQKESLKQLKTIKEQKEAFLGMFLGNLGTSLLGNMLAGKGTLRAGSGKGIVTATFGNKKGKGIVRAGYGNELNFECLVL